MRSSSRSPLYGLLTANAISQVGNIFAFIAIPWFVLQTTGSASKTRITVAAGALPVIIAGAFGGALVDRIGYKRASVLSDLAGSGAVLAIPLLHHTVGLACWQLLILVFLGAILDMPGVTARRSLIRSWRRPVRCRRSGRTPPARWSTARPG